MVTSSSILAWEIPWTEEPGGLQSMGSQSVRHDLAPHTQWKSEEWLVLDISEGTCARVFWLMHVTI